MPNDYFDSPAQVDPVTRARSSTVNDLETAIDDAFGKLPGETELKEGKVNYAPDTGTPNVFVVSLTHAPVAYDDGLEVCMKALNANSGACTLNVNGLGAKSVKNPDSSTPSAGAIAAGGFSVLRYNGDMGWFVLINPANMVQGGSSSYATLSGVEILSNKTLASPTIQNPTFSGAVTLPTPLALPTPTTTDATYDTQPLGALHITSPAPTTRNFLAGIWVETNGAAMDKGRGIMVNNYGASDGIYVQNDGAGATGFASLLTQAAANATGMVIGTTLSSHVGLEIRQETSITGSAAGVLINMQAEGAITEMGQVSSTLASQIGWVYRMWGAGALCIVVKDSGGVTKYSLSGGGDVVANTLTSSSTVSDSIGDLRIATVNTQNLDYTLVIGDKGKAVTKGDSVAHAYTVPPNSSVAFQIGTLITFVNTGGTTNNITITRGAGVHIYRAGTDANITVTPGDMVTLLKVGTDTWQA